MADLVPSERALNHEPEAAFDDRAAACEHGCNGCDDCTDYEDEDRDSPEFGCCLPPGECCMPGLHFPSECHTAADYEREQFGGWASDAGPRKTHNDQLRLGANSEPGQTASGSVVEARSNEQGLPHEPI